MVEEIERSLYVDDLISGGPTVEDAQQVKLVSTEIFSQASFEMHKWHSNAVELEPSSFASGAEPETYAKEQLGVPNTASELRTLICIALVTIGLGLGRLD